MNQRPRDYMRQRQMTIGDLLLENRIVFLDGLIHDASANLIVMKLLFLQSENRHQDIHLYINSPGGSVSTTMAIYDTMQFLDCPIATYCIGLAASGGAILLAGGTKGKRFALPALQDHDPPAVRPGRRTGLRHRDPGQGDPRDPRSRSIEILAQHTGQPIEVIARDTERDRYLTAVQAKEYGLVDEVLDQSRPRRKARRNNHRRTDSSPCESAGDREVECMRSGTDRPVPSKEHTMSILVPYVIEKSGREERAMDIYSRLLKDRIIILGTQVNDDVANLIVAQMLFLQFEDDKADIHLYINSPGGSSPPAWRSTTPCSSSPATWRPTASARRQHGGDPADGRCRRASATPCRTAGS